MPRTDNQKAVTAYLSLELYDQLRDFKTDEGLKSDSQAIAVILERFFNHCLALPVAAKPSADSALEEQLKQLEKKIALLESSWSERHNHIADEVHFHSIQIGKLILKSDVPSTVESDVLSTGEGDVLSTVEDDVPSTVESDVPSTVESTVESDVLSTGEGDVPSTVESTVEDDVPSTVEDDVPSTVEDDVPSTVTSTVDAGKRFVVCAYHPDKPKEPLYWHSRKKGFKAQLETATSYVHESKSRREGVAIEGGYMGDVLQNGWRVSYKRLDELRRMEAEKAAAIVEVN